jgi:hypothetical protein
MFSGHPQASLAPSYHKPSGSAVHCKRYALRHIQGLWKCDVVTLLLSQISSSMSAEVLAILEVIGMPLLPSSQY